MGNGRRRTDSRVIWLVAVLAVISPYPFGSVQPWAMGILVAGVFSALAVSLAGSLHRGAVAVPDTILKYLPFAVLFIAIIQTLPVPAWLAGLISPGFGPLDEAAGRTDGIVTLSLYPGGVWSRALFYISVPAVMLLVMRHLRKRKHAYWLLGWPLANGVVLAALGFMQKGGAAKTYLPFINRNHFAGYMEVLVPMAAAMLMCNVYAATREEDGLKGAFVRAFTGPSAIMSSALAGTVVILTGAVFLTASRGGALSLLSSFLVLSAALATRRWSARLLVGTFFVVCIAGLFMSDPALVAERFGRIGDTGLMSSYNLRHVVWGDSLSMLWSFPVFGVGIGSFESAYPFFKTLLLERNVFQPENDYLYVLAETGIAGFLICCIFCYKILAEQVGLVVNSRRRTKEVCLGAGALASFSALLVHGLVDTNLHVPATALTLGIFLAVGMVSLRGGLSDEERKRTRGYPKTYYGIGDRLAGGMSVRNVVRASVAVCLGVVALSCLGSVSDIGYRYALMEYREASGQSEGRAEKLADAESSLSLVSKLSPMRSDIPFELGRVRFTMHGLYDAEDDPRAEEYAWSSLAAYDRSLRNSPYSSLGRLMRGRVLEQALGLPDEAEEEYLRAERLNPTSPLIKANLSKYYYIRGEMELAREYEDMLPYLDPAYNTITIYDIAQEPDMAEVEIGRRIDFRVFAEVLTGELEYRYFLQKLGTGGPLAIVRDFDSDPAWEWDTSSEREGLYRVYVVVRGKGGLAKPVAMFADEEVYLKTP